MEQKPRFLQLENYELRGLDAFDVAAQLQYITGMSRDAMIKNFGGDADKVMRTYESFKEFYKPVKDLQTDLEKIKKDKILGEVEKQKQINRTESLITLAELREQRQDIQNYLDQIEDLESKEKFESQIKVIDEQINSVSTKLITSEQIEFALKQNSTNAESLKIKKEQIKELKKLLPEICQNLKIEFAEFEEAKPTNVNEFFKKLIKANEQVNFLG